MSAYNFGGNERNLTKLYQVTWLEARVIKWTLILQGMPLKNLGVQKCSKFTAIFDNCQIWSRISPERIDISKIGKDLYQLHFSAIGQKIGELCSTNQKVIDAHVDPPKWTFFRIY